MSALNKPAEAAPEPTGEQTEEAQLPVTNYRVVAPAQKTKEQELAKQAELDSHRASPEAEQQPAVPIVDSPVYKAPAPDAQAQAFAEQALKAGTQKSAANRTWIYAAVVIGLGVLLGVVVASYNSVSGTPNGRYDLGSADSSAAGLKGHLFVEWDKQLNYRLSIEPGDPDRKAAFATAVASSPHPLSVEIHLQDSEGFVLCSKEILLKYDPKIVIPPPQPDATPKNAKNDAKGAKTAAAAASTVPPAPVIDPAQAAAQAAAQEAAREKGKDIFQNQVGPDGQATAISAQGSIPCTAKTYEKAVAWSFSPNFPTIAEQDQLLALQNETTDDADHPSTAATAAAHKKTAAKTVQKLAQFSIEGDDAIVDLDLSRGMIETSSGKVFFIDKTSGAVSDRWQEYPVEIHYRCDQGYECTLMHSGAGSLRVRLRR